MNKIAQEIGTRSSTIGELIQFMWKEKLWWLIPFLLILLLIGALIFFAHSTPIGPFLYTVF